MVAWGGAKAEWNAQAASFAQYVTGKTAQEVADIAVTETTKPADGTDLVASVTIAIGGFQALIAKAMNG
jgi:sirohydrochlorin ferrochelatase